jgi:hypothetical protein
VPVTHRRIAHPTEGWFHREVLLIAIAKASKRIKDVERGQSFAEIARREEMSRDNQGEN